MIEIAIEPLEETIQSIRQINQNLNDILYELKGQMMTLEGSWMGETSKAFLDKVQLLDRNFDLYHQIVERYASHLEAIIEQYRLTEQNLHKNVSAF